MRKINKLLFKLLQWHIQMYITCNKSLSLIIKYLSEGNDDGGI